MASVASLLRTGPVKPARPPQGRGPGAGFGLSGSEQVEDVPDVGPPARRVALDVGSMLGERGTRRSRAAPSPRSRPESTSRPPAAGRAARRFPSFRARIFCGRRATVRGVSTETAARPRLLRLTQARIGDMLDDGNGTRVAIINAFTTVNPETEATVRAVDYQVVDVTASDQFRLYSDDERDVARWRRVERPELP